MIWAKVKVQFEGTHYYKEASGEEEFLKYPHRHMFHVTVWIEQEHDNRDVEYIKLNRRLSEFLRTLSDFKSMSCEQIAKAIATFIEFIFPNRKVKVEVMEDGENGCLYE